MKIKTAELTGAALDWAVAKCEDFDTRNNYRCQVIDADDVEYVFECYADDDVHAEEQALDAYPYSEVYLIEHIGVYTPSTDWSQGGPIIEREGISIEQQFQLGQGNDWAARLAWLDEPQGEGFGPTPLIATMRCYCVSKLGDELDVPGELLCKS